MGLLVVLTPRGAPSRRVGESAYSAGGPGISCGHDRCGFETRVRMDDCRGARRSCLPGTGPGIGGDRRERRMPGRDPMTRLTVVLGERRYDIVRPWGQLPEGLLLSGVSHVAVDSADRLYIYQRSDPPIVILDRDGHYVGARGQGLLADAHGMYIDGADRLFVIDRDRPHLHALHPSGVV